MTNSLDNWHLVCKEDDIDMEDLIRFDNENSTYCIYKIEDGFYESALNSLEIDISKNHLKDELDVFYYEF